MSKFIYKRYPDIENSYQDKVLEYIELRGYAIDSEKWSVSEKIHGANVGAYCDGTDVKWASRSAFVGDSFYGLFNGLSESLEPKLKALTDAVRWVYDSDDDIDIDYIIVYGELFGGHYPHQDVQKLQVSKIQDRVWYSPNVEFSAFDIFCVCGKNSFFMDSDAMYTLFNCSNIFYSKELFQGTLAECMARGNSFNSTIPTRLGLPELPVNTCEGLVIKPVKARTFPSGSRVILKSKNIKFTEKAERVKKERKPMTPEQLEAVEISECYITDNRLDNVLSKGDGIITQQLIGKYIGLLVKDAIEDLNKESDCLTALEKADRKPVTKNLQDLAKKLVLSKVEYVV